jgi:NAD(P)-dependent dehydrogenase (short-subunit alcohol dehydrogenase family)
VTPGSVVFRNPLIELIQYAPSTPTVHKRPLVIVPPCINKYYILDLRPANSFVRHAVAQGHTVFMVSWRNIPPELGHLTWDDYLSDGVLEAIRVAKDIGGSRTVNALGFCVGGTLLACALAVLAERRDRSVESATFLTTMLDFADPGEIGVYVTPEFVAAREPSLCAGQRMQGAELAGAFASLRANELVWNYVVRNYLKGQTPPAFDLLYWNGDSANLPGPMYARYLKDLYIDNKLTEPGALTMAGETIDLGEHHRPDLRLRVARGPHRAVEVRVAHDRADRRDRRDVRARRVGPHRGRDQPARAAEAQPLGQRPAAGRGGRMARARRRGAGQLVAALVALARAARRPARRRAGPAGQRGARAARSRAGALRRRADALGGTRVTIAGRIPNEAGRKTPARPRRQPRRRPHHVPEHTARRAHHRRHGRPRRGDLHQDGRARLQGRHDLLAGQHQGRRVARRDEPPGLRIPRVPVRRRRLRLGRGVLAEGRLRGRPIDVLVNNAGITRDMTFKKMDKVNWDAVMSTNLDSCFNMTKQVCDGMVDRGWGRIINISSVNGQKGAFGQTNYSAAKAGMHGFTKALALEVARKGVTVNTISPGYIGTKMVMAIPKDVLDSKIIPQIPMGRLGKPEEVAGLVAYLASEEAAFLTGANIAINGGQHMS